MIVKLIQIIVNNYLKYVWTIWILVQAGSSKKMTMIWSYHILKMRSFMVQQLFLMFQETLKDILYRNIQLSIAIFNISIARIKALYDQTLHSIYVIKRITKQWYLMRRNDFFYLLDGILSVTMLILKLKKHYIRGTNCTGNLFWGKSHGVYIWHLN